MLTVRCGNVMSDIETSPSHECRFLVLAARRYAFDVANSAAYGLNKAGAEALRVYRKSAPARRARLQDALRRTRLGRFRRKGTFAIDSLRLLLASDGACPEEGPLAPEPAEGRPLCTER